MSEPTAPASPQPSAAQKRLGVFVGNWRVEGESYGDGQRPDDPRASAVAWAGEDKYDWLPGGFFLIRRVDAKMGTRILKTTEIIGYDESKGGYFSHLFDNAGFHPEYKVTVDGSAWSFNEASSRSRLVFSDDNRELKIDWEWRNDGSDWLPLCNLVAKRID